MCECLVVCLCVCVCVCVCVRARVTCNQDVGSAGGQLRAAAALARESGLAEEEADALEALADVAMMRFS